jgi:hypothetical protein
MAQTTISLARLVELKVPIVWQEAVEIVRALEGASLSQGTLITLEDALISTDGTVILAPPGPAHDVWLSPLRLLDRLLDGVSMPPELRSLIGSDADALSSFPSEGESPKKSVTLDWFSRPDGASLIGRLAARGIAAYTATGSTASAPAAEVSTVLPTPVADYWPPGAFALPSPAFAPKPRQPEPTTAPSPSPLAREAPPVVPVEASPRRLAPKTSPAPLAVEASRSPLAKGVASLQTALSPTANSLLEQLRHKLNQLPFPELRERVSGVIRLRENLPEGFTGVIAAAGGATLLMVVTAWAWLPARAEVPTIAARGPAVCLSCADPQRGDGGGGCRSTVARSGRRGDHGVVAGIGACRFRHEPCAVVQRVAVERISNRGRASRVSGFAGDRADCRCRAASAARAGTSGSRHQPAFFGSAVHVRRPARGGRAGRSAHLLSRRRERRAAEHASVADAIGAEARRGYRRFLDRSPRRRAWPGRASPPPLEQPFAERSDDRVGGEGVAVRAGAEGRESGEVRAPDAHPSLTAIGNCLSATLCSLH